MKIIHSQSVLRLTSITCPVNPESNVIIEVSATNWGLNKLFSGSIPKFWIRIGVLVLSKFVACPNQCPEEFVVVHAKFPFLLVRA